MRYTGIVSMNYGMWLKFFLHSQVQKMYFITHIAVEILKWGFIENLWILKAPILKWYIVENIAAQVFLFVNQHTIDNEYIRNTPYFQNYTFEFLFG